MRRLALALVLMSAAHGAVAETVTVPAAAPPLATDIRYRMQTATTVSLAGKGTRTIRGDFHNTLKVGARSAAGWKVTWSADAAAPADGPYEVNDHYRQTLALYGMSSVAAQTDGRGALLRLDDGGALRRSLDDTIRRTFGNAPIPPGSVLDTLVRRIDAEPTFPLRALIPAIDLVIAMQADQPIATEIGKVEARTEQRSFGEIAAPTIVKHALVSVDRAARTATFTWSDEADADAVARSAHKFLDGELANARAQGTLTPLQMLELTTVWARREGLARISLDDGLTLYAEETLSLRLGPMRNETKTRVTRE